MWNSATLTKQFINISLHASTKADNVINSLNSLENAVWWGIWSRGEQKSISAFNAIYSNKVFHLNNETNMQKFLTSFPKTESFLPINGLIINSGNVVNKIRAFTCIIPSEKAEDTLINNHNSGTPSSSYFCRNWCRIISKCQNSILSRFCWIMGNSANRANSIHTILLH